MISGVRLRTLVLSRQFPNLPPMALSKQDQAFYEEKLNYKSIGYLFGATTAHRRDHVADCFFTSRIGRSVRPASGRRTWFINSP